MIKYNTHMLIKYELIFFVAVFYTNYKLLD